MFAPLVATDCEAKLTERVAMLNAKNSFFYGLLFLLLASCFPNPLADDKRADENTPYAVGFIDGTAIFERNERYFRLDGDHLVPLEGALTYAPRRSQPPKRYQFDLKRSSSGSTKLVTNFQGQEISLTRSSFQPLYIGDESSPLAMAYGIVNTTRFVFKDTPEALYSHALPLDQPPKNFHTAFGYDPVLRQNIIWDIAKDDANGPSRIWITNADLDLIATHDFRNVPRPNIAKGYTCFSCGCSCYAKANTHSHNGRHYVLITGYPVVPEQRGLFELDLGVTPPVWIKRIPGNLTRRLAFTDDGCAVAYSVLSKRGDQARVADLCAPQQ